MSWLILLALLKKLDKKIDDLETVTFKKVDELPATGEANVIYFVPKETAEEGNYSDEYIWDSASETYEQIGDTAVSTVVYKEFLINESSGSAWYLVSNTIKDIIDCIDEGALPVIVGNDSNAYRYTLNKLDNNFIAFARISNNFDTNFTLTFDKSQPNKNSCSVSRFTPTSSITSYDNKAVKSSAVYNALLPKVNYSVLAPDYSTSSTYDLGDLVIYNNNLYECTTAIPTAESWTAAHWTQVKVSDELDKKANLTDIPADANHNIASAYDSTATYAVGDLCIYNVNLYECSTAISTAEAWDSTHWTQKTVAQELANAGGCNVEIFDTYISAGNEYLANNKTGNDILNSINSGKKVYIKNSVGLCEFLYKDSSELHFIQPASSSQGRSFISIKIKIVESMLRLDSKNYSYLPVASQSYEGKTISINSQGTWVITDFPTELPAVTSSDEGKALLVNDQGQWAAGELPAPSGGWTDVTGTLVAGQTAITLNSSAITADSTIDVYTNKFGVNPTNIVVRPPQVKTLRQALVSQESELDITVTANTNWNGYDPWKAFGDNSVSGAWIGAGGDPHYLQIEFDTPTSIREIDFVSVDSQRSHAISRVGYSSDGTTFTECGIVSSTMESDTGHCELDDDYEAKYFRFYFDGSYGISEYPDMSKVEVYGYDEDPQGTGSVTLTFDAQSTNTGVKVRVS